MENLYQTPKTASPERTVVGMHFVCRDDTGVMDYDNGVFLTGSWKIDPKHAETAEYVALHSSRSEPSYRQGRLVASYEDPLQEGRLVLIVFADDQPREWQGHGTGEKGYLWRD